MNYSEKLQQAIQKLRTARRILVLTGAGISAESGIPTFRGGGAANTWRGMPFDQLSSARLVEDDLPLLWDWFDYRRGVIGSCRPNSAHESLARASRIERFRSFTVVTQNIDGLHQAADTREVIELHGNIWRARCLTCGRIESLRVIPQDERPPLCNECRDSMRPDVVLFGEALPAANLFTADELASKCDVCVVIGTSAQVYPAAAIPFRAKDNGAMVIEINPEETELTGFADISLHGKASEVLFDLFTFLEEPFESLEEIQELDVDIKLDEIRIDEYVPGGTPAQTDEESARPSLSFLLADEFESSRTLIVEMGYEGAGARVFRFAPEEGEPFYFVSASGMSPEGEDGEEWVEWEPELVASVSDGLRTIAAGDAIFYATAIFVSDEYRDEVKRYLSETLETLPSEESEKLARFRRPTTADEWLDRADKLGRIQGGTGQTTSVVNPFSSPAQKNVEAGTSGGLREEESVGRQFLLFWRETTVTAALRMGRVLDVVSSNQLEGVGRGDTLWVATVDGGELALVGRMRVGEIIDRAEADRRFGDENIWKSNLFAIALDEQTCELPRRMNVGERAFDLRFMEAEAERFIPVNGRISRSQTRKMRELDAESAALLASIWEGEAEEEVGDEDWESRLIDFDDEADDDAAPEDVDAEKLVVYEGCLLGGAVGDALGAAVEFDSLTSIRSRFGDSGLTDYATAFGRIGAVTDDTQMTLFTAEGLLRAETRRSHRGICYPAGVIYHAYLRWLQTQGRTPADETLAQSVAETPSWLRDIPEMNSLRAPGTTCLNALESGTMGTLEEPINDRKGCGGVMRVAPVGLIAADPFGLACQAAAITHGHPSGYLSAGVLALIVGKLVDGSSLLEAVEHAVYEELPKHEGHGDTLEACDRAVRLAKLHLGILTEESWEGGEPDEGRVDNGISPEAVESLGAGWIAEEALAISIYCSLVFESDFEKGVLLAVNHSGDSDSTGAITGNILGTRLGAGAIPERWLAQLELRDTIQELSRDLLIGFRSGDEWWDRYPGA